MDENCSYSCSDGQCINPPASDTLYVNLSASPDSGCYYLNDVDLTASVSGTASGDITYKFDCTNDGTWDSTITSSNSSYTATDLCDYTAVGNYTAKVSVERNGLTAINTDQIDIIACGLGLNFPPVADAGSDKSVTEGNTVILSGSGTDPDGDPITYFWSCTGGTLSNSSIAQPVFTAPYVSSDTGYTCTLTVTDSHSATGSDSMVVTVNNFNGGSENLSVSLTANPYSACSSLNNVDLTASVSGNVTGNITYKFDCTNNGTWDKTITTSDTSYTAVDLCDYTAGQIILQSKSGKRRIFR